MDSLYELVQGLPPKELNAVKSYLSFYTSAHNADDSLILKLFNFLLNAKLPPTESECIHFIYSEAGKEEPYKKLRYRLKTKILDAFTVELGEEKKEIINEIDFASIRVRKKVMQSRLLFFINPKFEIARDLMEEAILECKKYELYAVLVELLEAKRWRYTYKEDEKEFNKIIIEGEYYKACHDATVKANDYYYQLIFLADGKEKDEKKVKIFLERSIDELSRLAVKTKSGLVAYYLKFFELYSFMRVNNYKEARNVCSEMVKIISNNPAVKRKQRLAIVYDNFSRCDLMLGKYDEALQYAKKAQENFPPSSINQAIAKEQEFYALFFSGSFEDAEKVILMILAGTSRKEVGEIRYAKFNFLHANVLFRQGKFKDAMSILRQKYEISKDKDPWEIELRLLTLMCCVELNQTEEAKLLAGSLKKYIQRNKHRITQRHTVILKVVLQAARKDFIFSENAKPALELLSDANGKYKWQMLSSELIPFHEWVKKKLKVKV